MIVPRFIKSAYRKDSMTSFLIIMGGVDAIIGGVGSRGTLVAFGMMLVLGAIAIRWINSQGNKIPDYEETPVHYLPMGETQRPLPQLASKKRRSSY